MSYELTAFLKLIIEFVKIYFTMWAIVGLTPKKNIIKYSWAIIPAFIIFFLVGLCGDYNFAINSALVVGVIFAIFIYNDTMLKKVVFYAIITVMSNLLNTFISTSVIFLLNDFNYIADVNVVHIICNVSILPLILISVILRLKNKKEHIVEDNSLLWSEYLIIFIGMIFCYLIIIVTQYMMLGTFSSRVEIFFFILINTSCMVFFLITVWQVRVMMSRNYYKNRDIISKKYIDIQEENFTQILEKENQLRRFRHDLRAHMIAIKELSERKDYDNLLLYTTRILNEVDSFKRYNYSGNHVVDAVISDIVKNCENSGIELIWKGHLPDEIGVDRFDLCAIISNVLKNAIEACYKIQDENNRKIFINVGTYENTITIHEHNYVENEVMMINGRPQTDKEDKTLHGHGTYNIEKCASKYNGTVNYDVNDNVFSIDIIIHQNNNIKKMHNNDEV